MRDKIKEFYHKHLKCQELIYMWVYHNNSKTSLVPVYHIIQIHSRSTSETIKMYTHFFACEFCINTHWTSSRFQKLFLGYRASQVVLLTQGRKLPCNNKLSLPPSHSSVVQSTNTTFILEMYGYFHQVLFCFHLTSVVV